MEPDLSELEERSIFVIREAKAQFRKVAALWSTGKDSTVALHLCRQAFLGSCSIPAIHIDNGLDFPETYAMRTQLATDWGLTVLIAQSQIKPDEISGVSCCGANKTEALKRLLHEHRFDGLIVSIRRDEHGIRSKERYFSPRDEQFRWAYQHQPTEFLHHFSRPEGASHVRIHPLLHWTELDIWRYIKAKNLPVNPLYFAHHGQRFRSLGCTRCTVAVPSSAQTVVEILEELRTTQTLERTGRAQDKERDYVMQRLRALGYM